MGHKIVVGCQAAMLVKGEAMSFVQWAVCFSTKQDRQKIQKGKRKKEKIGEDLAHRPVCLNYNPNIKPNARLGVCQRRTNQPGRSIDVALVSLCSIICLDWSQFLRIQILHLVVFRLFDRACPGRLATCI